MPAALVFQSTMSASLQLASLADAASAGLSPCSAPACAADGQLTELSPAGLCSAMPYEVSGALKRWYECACKQAQFRLD